MENNSTPAFSNSRRQLDPEKIRELLSSPHSYKRRRKEEDPQEKEKKERLQELAIAFGTACFDNNDEKVQSLLCHPDLEINDDVPFDANYLLGRKGVCESSIGGSALDLMSFSSDFDISVPDVLRGWGASGLAYACYQGSTEVVRILLADPRLDVNKGAMKGFSPLLIACLKGHEEIVALLIQHKDTRLTLEGYSAGHPRRPYSNILEVCDTPERERLRDIILSHAYPAKFDQIPEAFISQGVENIKCLAKAYAGEIFAHVIFLSDGLFKINPAHTKSKPARFLQMAQQLPQELQEVLCNRVAKRPGSLITSAVAALAFQNLARKAL